MHIFLLRDNGVYYKRTIVQNVLYDSRTEGQPQYNDAQLDGQQKEACDLPQHLKGWQTGHSDSCTPSCIGESRE